MINTTQTTTYNLTLTGDEFDVLYELLDDVSRQSMFEKAHYAGGYLYLRWLIYSLSYS